METKEVLLLLPVQLGWYRNLIYWKLKFCHDSHCNKNGLSGERGIIHAYED
uniref:Uncharacterized protein n=1 Tax=Rhizophora mucronata TaxID=61149 RepID=A0A2P2NFB4_RHIMU